MNGMGAVCIATGNDWRALEAGAHAYCCRDGKYGPMTTWSMSEDGDALIGRLDVPIQIGTVGGPTRLHPMAQVAQRMLGIDKARELGEVMGAVGLAQNLAALKALGTEGIQSGHMALHARSVAATVGADDEEMEWLVDELIDRDEVTVSVARDLLDAHRE
jgi:hydroxymethylglutaryl-CoA reductase